MREPTEIAAEMGEAIGDATLVHQALLSSRQALEHSRRLMVATLGFAAVFGVVLLLVALHIGSSDLANCRGLQAIDRATITADNLRAAAIGVPGTPTAGYYSTHPAAMAAAVQRIVLQERAFVPRRCS